MPKTTRPCPYCGEEIKINAVKCRFCGEFLEEEEDDAREDEDDEEDDDGGALKWVAPVGRSPFAIIAGYLGIISLIPYPFIMFGFFYADGKIQKTEQVIKIGMYINMATGALAVVAGILGVTMVMVTKRVGLPRSIFAILAGLTAAIGYYFGTDIFIRHFVNPNLGPLPNKQKDHAPADPDKKQSALPGTPDWLALQGRLVPVFGANRLPG